MRQAARWRGPDRGLAAVRPGVRSVAARSATTDIDRQGDNPRMGRQVGAGHTSQCPSMSWLLTALCA